MTKEEFQKRMMLIDREQISENIPIPLRPLDATRRFAMKYQCRVYIGVPSNEKRPKNKYSEMNLGDRIKEWYEQKYENTLNGFLNMGQVGLLISGDVFKLKIPIIFCAMIGEEDGKKTELDRIPDHQLFSFNIFKLIENITPKLIEDMTDEEKTKAYAIFNHSVELYNLMRKEHLKSTLIDSAKSDFEKAIDYLMGENRSTGLSKWSSLQATEKVLKSVISFKDMSFPKSHNLSQLLSQLYSVGLVKIDENLINQVQCSPSIRYGDNKYTLADAILSHHYSIYICKTVLRFCV